MSNRKDLANGVVQSVSGNTIVLKTGYGQTMPDVPFKLTCTPPGELSTMGNSEIVKVTGRLEDTLTIERAQNGTTQKDIGENWIVANAIYTSDKITSDNIDFTTLNVTNSVAFANTRSITTSFATLYTATSFCFVNVYLDYTSTGKNTVVRAGGVEKYLSPQYGRGNVGVFLNVGQTIDIKADTAYTIGWMRIDVQSF